MKRLLILLLTVCLLLPTLAACKEDTGAPVGQGSDSATDAASADSDEVEAAKRIFLSKNKKSVYKVIVPANCSEALMTAAHSLVSRIQKVTGLIVTMVDDTTYDGEPVASENEIIIGNCKRKDMQAVLKNMRYGDYKITVTENNNILIATYSEDIATTAIFRFMSFLGDDKLTKEDGSVSMLWAEDIYVENPDYEMPDISIIDHDITEYRIVYDASKNVSDHKALAESLSLWFGEQSGYSIEYVPDTEAATELEILIGRTNRPESQIYYTGNEALDIMQYGVSIKNDKIVIAGAGDFSTEQAVEEFKTRIVTAKGDLNELDTGVNKLQTAFSKLSGDYRIMQYNVLVEYEGWGSGGIIKPSVDYRREITESVVRGYDVDVAVFNEFFDTWRKVFPPALSDTYTFVELDRKDGVSNRNAIAFKTEKFTLVDSGYTDIMIVDNSNKRAVTWAVLKDKLTGKQLIIFGTHFDWDYTEAQRTVQANAAAQVVKNVTSKYSGTVVFMGDLNHTVDTAPYKKLVEETGLKHSRGENASGIDHILVEDTATVRFSWVENAHYTEYASDHRPTFCDIQVNE